MLDFVTAKYHTQYHIEEWYFRLILNIISVKYYMHEVILEDLTPRWDTRKRSRTTDNKILNVNLKIEKGTKQILHEFNGI